jgi:hypothetical protein
MIACQQLPNELASEMLQIAARAICDRPSDSPAQRESRTRQMVYSTVGMQPRDGLEYMLATLVFGHFNLILDSMREVFQGQMDSMKAKTKTTIVALDRSMLALVKELRTTRQRPVMLWAESAAQKAAEATIGTPDVAVAAEPASVRPMEPASERTSNPAAERTTNPAPVRTTDPNPAAIVPPMTETARFVSQTPAVETPAAEASFAVDTGEVDDATFAAHIADFRQAMADAAAALAEARALDAAPDAIAASGD